MNTNLTAFSKWWRRQFLSGGDRISFPKAKEREAAKRCHRDTTDNKNKSIKVPLNRSSRVSNSENSSILSFLEPHKKSLVSVQVNCTVTVSIIYSYTRFFNVQGSKYIKKMSSSFIYENTLLLFANNRVTILQKKIETFLAAEVN